MKNPLPKKTLKISNFPSDSVAGFLSENDYFWEKDQVRSKNYKQLSHSRSILLIYDENHPETFINKFHEENKQVWLKVKPVLDHLQIILGPGYWCRALLAELPAKAEIKSHIDPGWPFLVQKRYHWVIKTNPSVIMNVADINYHFLKDEIWEFNNKAMHSVLNGGESSRIHLVADYVFENEALYLYPKSTDLSNYENRLLSALSKKGIE